MKRRTSAVLVPHELSVWNQNKMSMAYNIQENIRTGSTDAEIMKKCLEEYSNYDYMLVITFSTHNPFVGYPESTLRTPDGMPDLMARYLKANHYLDDCLGDFLLAVDANDDLKDATIVFVGDHTVFYQEQREDFDEYCKAANLDYEVTEPYGPLIIYSPAIEKKEKYEEPSLQMDAYPTILHTIGCDHYYWKGVGVDLRDSIARSNRPLDETEAYDLSDKLIRADFFREYLKIKDK